MEQAILTAAKRTFGVNRELEARFNGEIGQVDLYQYMTVVDEVDDEEREISAKDASRYGLEADLGEELGFQIFYLTQDSDKARDQDKEFGDLLQLEQARQGFGRIFGSIPFSLLGVDGSHVAFEQDGQVVQIPHAEITKAHLVHQF